MNTREKLEKFHETVNELRSTRLMEEGLNTKMTLRYSAEKKELEFDTEWPDEEDLRSFLLTFRHFVAKNEDVLLDKIFNLCQQKLNDEKLREFLVGARRIWKKAQKTIGFDIVHEGKRKTPQQITQLFLSGMYFHKDEEKRAELKGLPYPQAMFYKYEFLSYLADSVRVIFYVDRIVAKVLEERLFKD